MESICVVGGIKSEPSIIEYVPPSIEITFSDIDSGEDEPKTLNKNQLSVFIKEEPEKDKETQDVFRYMGYDSGKSNGEVETCIFNFTKNEDLCVYTKEIKQLQDQSNGKISPTPDITRSVSDIYNTMENDKGCVSQSLLGSERSDNDTPANFEKLAYGEESRLKFEASSGNGNQNKSRTTDETSDVKFTETITRKKQYVFLPESKIDLNMALFSENIFPLEYKKTDNSCYRCAHCGTREYTLRRIREHIIENHRETEIKQCPHCDVKTKVLQYHLKNHPSNNCTVNRSESAHRLPDSEQSVKARKANDKFDFHAALFSDNLSSKEYSVWNGTGRCLHCDFRDTLENIKIHITTTHRKTELKQCSLCNTRTRVLTYHLKTIHKCNPKQVPLLLAKYAEINKKIGKDTNDAAAAQTQVSDKQPVICLVKTPRHKVDLNTQLYSEDFSHLEYMKRKIDCFRCLHCGHLDTKEKIIVHITENHRKTELKQCPFCDVQTRVLKYHLRKHDTPLEYKCKECNYETINTSKLNRHIKQHHEERIMAQCNICHKVYPSKIRLVEHIRRYHADSSRMFSCNFCSYTSIIKAAVTVHMEKHRTEDELNTLFKCDKCNFQTKYRRKIASHKNMRHKMFFCDQCGTKVSTKLSLKLHMLLHKEKLEDEDLPIRCDKCDYRTSRHYNLAVHKLKHKKPEEKEYFYCYHCEFKANRKDNLKTHIFKHFQKEEVVFHCFVCDFTTTKKSKLIRHIDKHSNAK